MVRRRKRFAEWDSGCRAAHEQLREMINSFGYSEQDLDQLKKRLNQYIPPEVLFDMFGTNTDDRAAKEEGHNLLFSLFAIDILRAYCSTRDSSISRRLLFERDQEPIDFVMSVMTGYRKSGIVENGILDLINRDSRSSYRPGGDSTRFTKCPHCNVSFWTRSAGNGNPQYKNVKGWRATEEEAPEHVVVDKSTGAPVGDQGGYHFCGGKHRIYLLNPNSPAVNIELAERLGGLPYNELQEIGRIRAVERNDRMDFFLVDDYLPQVEEILQSKKALDTVNKSLKGFDENWVLEEGNDVYFRQCRFPIELLSPVQVVKKRIQFYQPYTSVYDGVEYIDIYKCPYCHASYRDREGITDAHLNKESRVTILRCQNCNKEFDITDSEVKHTKGKDVKYSDSLDTSMTGGDDEEREFTNLDVVQVGDDHVTKLELDEFKQMLKDEVIRVAQGLNIRGSENAWDIFEDVVDGKGLKEITEKYFEPYYQLHYSYCADCGYQTAEKSNPTGEDAKMYDQGLPVNLQRCPRRHESPQHNVLLPTSVTPQEEQQDEEASMFSDLIDNSLREQELERQELHKEMNEISVAKTISDPYERQKYLGLNIIYVGRSPQDHKKEMGTCYQVTGWAQQGDAYIPTMAKALPPGTYDKQARVTRHIYAPAERLLRKLREGLLKSPVVREHEWSEWLFKQMQKQIEEVEQLKEARRKVRKFCKAT